MTRRLPTMALPWLLYYISCKIWITYSLASQAWNHALKLLFVDLIRIKTLRQQYSYWDKLYPKTLCIASNSASGNEENLEPWKVYTKYNALESISEDLSLTTTSHLHSTIISCPCAILPCRHWEDWFVGRQRHSPLYLVDWRNLMIFEVSYLRQHWSVRFQLYIYLCVLSEKAILLVSKPGSRGIGKNTTWFLNTKSRRDRDSRIRAFWDEMTLSYLIFRRAELDGGNECLPWSVFWIWQDHARWISQWFDTRVGKHCRVLIYWVVRS